MTDLKTRIQDALNAFREGRLLEDAGNLLNILGYKSDKTFSLRPNNYQGFADYFLQTPGNFDPQRARVEEWQSIDIVFQLTEAELKAQQTLFEIREVDNRIIESYLFFAIALTGETYTRGDLVRITREINKLTPMPAMILFYYNGHLTISVIDRRLHKKERSKDVLEKVTLIKDIDCAHPHRAHIEILHDLALDQLRQRQGFTNFVELHRAWQKTLDTSELNKRFFKEIADWYFWAIKKVKYPNPHHLTEQHNHSLNVIRLLTRLIFCWFLKEKKLLPEALFNPAEIAKILIKSPSKQEDGDQSSYYKAILQNLFFATLNTDMNKDVPRSRCFITDRKSAGGVSEGYSVPTVFRYKQLFQEKEKAIRLFEDIPFLNGGLFECLDTFETVGGKNVETRIDGFSSTFSKQPVVFDELFFSEETIIDLSGDYGSPKYANTKVKGLICILEKYKFTIEENTPVEEEIALDPELLGKVFENLLANYNLETQTTARKQTGSFYTPREIVNYMVDESLLRYLEDKLLDFHAAGGYETLPDMPKIVTAKKPERLSSKEKKTLHDKLRHLLAYTEEGHLFKDGKGSDTSEVDALIDAINNCKILDPACGSGAFPMGILHKMVFILAKLDPFNTKWKQAQLDKAGRDRERAEKMEDEEIRRHTLENIEQRILAIEEAFGGNRHELDYTRKLFLIENCIYGVDIQNIAVQIAKLRFFISLVVDQKVMDDRPNRNILALPNLETKFVAANTLIGIDKPQQELQLGIDKVYAVENELKNLRQRLFYTRKYAEKKKLRQAEKSKREGLKKALIENRYSTTSAGLIASWNPFDPVHAAGFFDMETMFNIQDGFDIVIGNPPYFNISTVNRDLYRYLADHYKIIHTGYNDIVYYFIYRGIELLRENGCCALITSNYFLGNDYARNLRRYLNNHISKVINFKDHMVFDAASIHTCISFSCKEARSSEVIFFEAASDEKITSSDIESHLRPFSIQRADLKDDWIIADQSSTSVFQKLKHGSVLLGDIAIIAKGSESGRNDIFTVTADTVNKYKLEKSIIRKCIKNSNIKKYFIDYKGLYLIYADNDFDPSVFKYSFEYL
ncbi:MAG TPA: N-6 DNA methylase, partial [Syntrophales bacterium]|nr:N-6 DNA methylase [Syntrophales bacterium]